MRCTFPRPARSTVSTRGSRPAIRLLLILAALAIPAAASAQQAAVVYGGSFSIQNAYQGWSGGFLDVNDTGCEGNLYCVSTSVSSDRAVEGTASWRFVSAAQNRRPIGALVAYGDTVHLQNSYQGWAGGYLDTRGGGCEGNRYCVSTASSSDRAEGSGRWVVYSAGARHPEGAPVLEGHPVLLMNLYGGVGGFLDVMGAGCEANAYCVSTSSSANRVGQNTAMWRMSQFRTPKYLTIDEITLLHPATGIDNVTRAVVGAVAGIGVAVVAGPTTGLMAGLVYKALATGFSQAQLTEWDEATSGTDQLYLARSGRQLWPVDGSRYVGMEAGDTQTPGIRLPLTTNLVVVDLMEYDSASEDDLLGTVTLSATTPPGTYGCHAKTLADVDQGCYLTLIEDEGAVYSIKYTVHPEG